MIMKLKAICITVTLFFVTTHPIVSMSKIRSCLELEKLFNQNSSLRSGFESRQEFLSNTLTVTMEFSPPGSLKSHAPRRKRHRVFVVLEHSINMPKPNM